MTAEVVSPEVAVACACELGEGPTWDAAQERLLWLDIDAQVLHQIGGGGHHTTTTLQRRVTAIVPDRQGGLVGAVDGTVARIDESGRIGSVIATLPSAGDGVTNDGRCDPLGRLWIGTTDRSGARRAGLFCVGADGSVVTVREGVGLSNGLDWSPDGNVCHYVDSFAGCIENLYLGREWSATAVRHACRDRRHARWPHRRQRRWDLGRLVGRRRGSSLHNGRTP